MSTDHSDSRGSQQTPLTAGPPKKPPFKVCFPKHQMIGRSDVRVSEIDAKFISPKFYSLWSHEKPSESVKKMVRETMEKEGRGPRDLYHFPLLNSQSYGWWYDRRFDSNDPRFNFHKNTSDMVLSTALIQCEDKKLKGLLP